MKTPLNDQKASRQDKFKTDFARSIFDTSRKIKGGQTRLDPKSSAEY